MSQPTTPPPALPQKITPLPPIHRMALDTELAQGEERPTILPLRPMPPSPRRGAEVLGNIKRSLNNPEGAALSLSKGALL